MPVFIDNKKNTFQTEIDLNNFKSDLNEIAGIVVTHLNGINHNINDSSNNNVDGGNHWWNLRTRNNQEVAPGLYIFVVDNLTDEKLGQKYVGKFAVVR